MKLRYMFEAGAGVCLWAHDEEARVHYGYPVSLEYLPLSNDTVDRGHDLISAFDGSIDWRNPAGESVWTDEERQQFAASSAAFLARLRGELGDAVELVTDFPA